MRLPAGKTCGHCTYFTKCSWLVQAKPWNTWCDWSPSRFRRGPFRLRARLQAIAYWLRDRVRGGGDKEIEKNA